MVFHDKGVHVKCPVRVGVSLYLSMTSDPISGFFQEQEKTDLESKRRRHEELRRRIAESENQSESSDDEQSGSESDQHFLGNDSYGNP